MKATAACCVAVAVVAFGLCRGALVLQETWEGARFFEHFSFFTAADPTHGTVEYMSRSSAESLGLIKATASGRVRIAVDASATVAPPAGRAAVRIESLRTVSSGQMLVADVLHAPYGCATWPALWLCGPDWPTGGEIDVFETVNAGNATQTTLHTSGRCDQSATKGFTGRRATGTSGQPATDCWVDAPGQWANEGCGIIASQGTAGSALNAGGGGVFAAWWAEDHIAVWFWRHGAVPADLEADAPQPAGWGLPYARFDFGDAFCKASYFSPQTLVINTALCGDWAGSAFATDCPGFGSCADFVRGTPSAFTDAFWEIGFIKFFGSK